MRLNSCSLQKSLEYDLDNIIQTQHLTTAQRFAISQLRAKALSKWEETNACADKAAIDEFLEQNRRPVRDHPLRQYLDDMVKAELAEMLADVDLNVGPVFRAADVGPGSSVGDSENNSFLGKFSGEVTYGSPDLLRLFEAVCNSDERWQLLYQELALTNRFTQKKGGRMSAVPKTVDISRLVVTPLLLNVFFDKGVGAQLEQTLAQLGIDLRIQPNVNRRLAMRGSSYGDMCTIDLKGASNHVRYARWYPLFPASLQWWLRLTRTDFVELPNKEWEELSMVQTMGSGLIFPLQTLCFLALCRVAYKQCGMQPRTTGSKVNLAVFGDDIIVHRRAYDTVISMLNAFELVINYDKTFADGPFRESCGADWFDGTNVRPFYIKKVHRWEDRYSVINRCTEWCLRLELPLLDTLIGDLLEWKKPRFMVPQHGEEYSGLRVTSEIFGSNSGEYNARQPLLTRVFYSQEVIDTFPTVSMLSILRGELASTTKIKNGTVQPYRPYGEIFRVKHRVHQPLYYVSIRVDTPKYTTRSCYTPNWDAPPVMPLDIDDLPIRGTSSWSLRDNIPVERFVGDGFGRTWVNNPRAKAWIDLSLLLASLGVGTT